MAPSDKSPLGALSFGHRGFRYSVTPKTRSNQDEYDPCVGGAPFRDGRLSREAPITRAASPGLSVFWRSTSLRPPLQAAQAVLECYSQCVMRRFGLAPPLHWGVPI